jgi:hypothetical protein
MVPGLPIKTQPGRHFPAPGSIRQSKKGGLPVLKTLQGPAEAGAHIIAKMGQGGLVQDLAVKQARLLKWSTLSGDGAMPGTVLLGAKAACSTSAK